MNATPIIPLLVSLSTFVPASPVLTQSLNNADFAFSNVCSQGQDQVFVESKQVTFWKSIIAQKGWTCQEQTADVPTGTLKFSCEPVDDGDQELSLITVTWLTGEDEKQQMGRWIHQFATQHAMYCSIAKTDIWGSFDQ